MTAPRTRTMVERSPFCAVSMPAPPVVVADLDEEDVDEATAAPLLPIELLVREHQYGKEETYHSW